MGFARPEAVAARVRAWHHGHIRATRDARARELLTDLMPQLLHALAAQSEPDAAFARFDEFVSNLPAGVQLFSLFRANPRLLALVADLMGIAPRLAGHLSRNVSLFDAMLAPDFFEPIPGAQAFAGELDRALARSDDVQDVLDAVRRFAHDREFQVGLHVLLGLIDGDAAAAILSDIAETVIRALLPRAEAWLAQQHGRIAGRRLRGVRPRQARQPRAGDRLRPRPDLHLRRAGGRQVRRRETPARFDMVREARPAPGQLADRQTPEGQPVRDRHPAAALRHISALSPARSTTSSATSSARRRPGSTRR